MITLERVTRSFGRIRAVRGISFEAPRGQVVGLLGPNGAGKTTTIRMITAFLPPSAGSVRVDGLDTIDRSREVRARIGYLPEAATLYPEMRAEDYLAHRAALHGVPRRRREAAIERSVERCWLRDVRRRRIGHLSKGYRQRVGLAAAMLHDPPVLILDEPSSGLDPTQIVQMRSLIRELGQDKTMIVCSHILPEVERTCDRIIMIARGRIRADGAIADLVDPLRGAARYIIEARPAEGDDAQRLFEDLPEVAETRREAAPEAHGFVRLSVTPWPERGDLRERLAEAARDRGALIRELRRDTPTLEQLFVRLVDAAEEEEDARRADDRPTTSAERPAARDQADADAPAGVGAASREDE